MKKWLVLAALFLSIQSISQDSTNKSPFSFDAYLETYYSYDLNKPEDNLRPGFLYSHNRHNEFNLNLGFIKAGYNAERMRANLAIGAGTYMNANYSAEPSTLRFLYEANVGYKLSAKKNLWFDIGIMPSHIGFESAISSSCWTLTRSMMADNSPYYESGAKISYTSENEKWQFAALALNGWQRITRVEGNSMMSFGIQVVYTPSEKITLNYSTFYGTDQPDSSRAKRFFHNLYGIFQLTEKIGITAGFDIGFEEKSPGSAYKNKWYTPVFIVRYRPHQQWAVALRTEYYNDQNGVIIKTYTPNGFKTFGASVNIDYTPLKNLSLRFEARHLNSKDAIFQKEGTLVNQNTALTFSTAISF